jgi:hypothetical protein
MRTLRGYCHSNTSTQSSFFFVVVVVVVVDVDDTTNLKLSSHLTVTETKKGLSLTIVFTEL